MIEFRPDRRWGMLILLAIAVVFRLNVTLPTSKAASGNADITDFKIKGGVYPRHRHHGHPVGGRTLEGALLLILAFTSGHCLRLMEVPTKRGVPPHCGEVGPLSFEIAKTKR